MKLFFTKIVFLSVLVNGTVEAKNDNDKGKTASNPAPVPVAVSISLPVPATTTTASSSSCNDLYSYKCGTKAFMCPGLSKSTVYNNPGAQEYIPVTAEQCTALANWVKSGSTSKFTCPSGQDLYHYVVYNNDGKGSKTNFGSTASEAVSCPTTCGNQSCGGTPTPPFAAPIVAPTPLTFGDPHFATYDGTQYTYHGECDLVIAHNPKFDNGLGLDIHARTEIVTTWSLIANAAVRIGSDILEVANDGSYYVNGVNDLSLPFQMAGKYEVTREVNTESVVFSIKLSEGDNIYISIFKSMIAVRASKQIGSIGGISGVVGMTGLVARDGKTFLAEPNTMGSEWQVRDTDSILFHKIRAPQYPQQCKLPASTSSTRRRLRSNDNMIHTAREACKDVVDIMRDFCVEDVLLTNDASIAVGYSKGISY